MTYFMVRTAQNSEGEVGFMFDVYDDAGLTSSRHTADNTEKAKVVFAKIIDNVIVVKTEKQETPAR